MLFLAHLGMTAGIFYAGNSLARRVSRRKIAVHQKKSPSDIAAYTDDEEKGYNSNSFIDYRLVMLGALLPDIIDKPAWLLAGGIYPNGRAYAHTMLFSLILLIAGLLLRQNGKKLLLLSLATLAHLTLDSMWLNTRTLLWPFFGEMLAESSSGYISESVDQLWQNPVTIVAELTGLVVLLWLGWRILIRHNLLEFIKSGIIC